jgi:LysM repeat protein
MYTKYKCVMLAWSILLILIAVGLRGPFPPAQANSRIASSIEIRLTAKVSVAAAVVPASKSVARYVVQPGETLSGIAEQLGVRGGWRALYAANRKVIGSNPNLIQTGTVLTLPGQKAPVRYMVAAGETLSGIAEQFAVRGGWRALYAANRKVIGPDPNVIRAGVLLTVPAPRTSAPVASSTGRHPRPAPPPVPAVRRHPRGPSRTRAPTSGGMPQWLTTMLIAVGLLIGAAFLAEQAASFGRRRRRAASQSGRHQAACSPEAPGASRAATGKARIILADYHRVVVTHSAADDTVCVLRPPDGDLDAILRVARLVLAEDPYEELVRQLGSSVDWPTGGAA